LLAAGIGVMLLAALYVAVNMQLRLSQSGRDTIEQSTLARALLQRIANDVASSIGPPSPTRYQTSSGQSSGGGSQTGQSGAGTGSGASASSSGAASSSSSGSGSSNSASGSGSGSSSTPNYVFTVQGDSSTLTVYMTKVPRELFAPSVMQGTDTPPETSDLRRVTYWLAGDGSLGLARQELLLVTSDDAANVPPNGIDNEADYVVAPEVRSLQFSYWDGANWQDSWDGTTAGSDGVTPIGPPLAIAVVIGIVPPSAGSDVAPKTYRHVIPITTANGVIQQSSSSSGTTQQNTGGIENATSTSSNSGS
jgi:hypothetical protein